MLEQRINTDDGTEESKRRVDGGSEEYEATRAVAADEPVLVGGLHAGGNCVQHTEPTGMVL